MASKDQPPANSAMASLLSARVAALETPELYKQVLPPVLGVMSDRPSLAMRRWVSGFIAEALGSAMMRTEDKEAVALMVLPALKGFLQEESEDIDIIKNAIISASVAYSIAFRHVIHHPEDAEPWQNLQAIKSSILHRMDSYPPASKACSVKFVQRVVQTQTPSTIDPRRPEKNETSLALVPRDHPLLHVASIEAETSGLLDRILGILQDESNDPFLISATINAVGSLVRSRPSIANKIINTVLSYNPLKPAAEGSLTTRDKILLRSVERTIRALFINIMRRNPTHPLFQRMQAYLERLTAGRLALFEGSKKRPAPGELARDDSPKKQRTVDPKTEPKTLPDGPVSVARLFSLAKEPGAQGFDVTTIPIPTVNQILLPIFQSIDPQRMSSAIQIVSDRIEELKRRASTVSPTSVEGDDYEPGLALMEDTEQIRNRIEMESSEDLGIGVPTSSHLQLTAFNLPPPLRLTARDLELCGRSSMDVVFRKIEAHPSKSTAPTAPKVGFNRIAATSSDREAMATIYTRLLTRPSACIPNEENQSATGLNPHVLSERGRMQLLQYILSNWKARMDVATTWLTEEWYNDQICKRAEVFKTGQKVGKETHYAPNFQKWIHRFLDELSAFIGIEDSKLLIRFVSEIPGIDRDIVAKIKRLANDPERIVMVVNAIHYLILFRPPVKNICLDALEDLWKNYEGAKSSTTAVLKKHRPSFLTEVAA